LAAARRLEEQTGRRLGHAEGPLLLSVRSGAAFSMPGMMDTILNVGLNQQLLETADFNAEARWGAWDCYRRYLQGVAMSCGVDRDLFDEIISRFKRRHRVDRKLQFTPRQMRDIALAYRATVENQRVVIHDDPCEQLLQAVQLVLRSWYSEPARVYRRQMNLAEEWGTAVIVQEMVFGNMSASSGSGVVFTRNPRSASTGIGLYGDFTMCSQGEDVVAGLVHPYPVSEAQRREYASDHENSLQTRLPGVYSRLKTIASTLINDHHYEHQEIEFTFESSDPSDLHILQIRPMRMLRQQAVPIFAQPESMEDREIATGTGVSGGALNGRVAFSVTDVDRIRSSHPDEGVVLLRPDTVPEDIGLVLAVDGVLTARGGFTSHAAVTAKRLGKCCIVNCSSLVVDDTTNVARIGSRSLLAGDPIAIDGVSGRVYLGTHDVIAARQASTVLREGRRYP
jgi:pyruvate,orthophosphate dikinase